MAKIIGLSLKVLFLAFFFSEVQAGFGADVDVDAKNISNEYIKCLKSKTSLLKGACGLIRDYIQKNASHYARGVIVDDLIGASGVRAYYYGGLVPPPKRDKKSCETNKGLLGYYDPTRRVIMVCSNNLEAGSSYLIDHVVQHEMVHAAQHCYGGTLSKNNIIKALYFSKTPNPEDYITVVELYPQGQWVDELEARAGLASSLEIDIASLLYLSCRVLSGVSH